MKKIILIILIILLIITVVITSSGIYSNNTLVVTEYNVLNNKLNTDLKIVLIADQHNHQFGENDIELVNKIAEQNPDIIVVDGDMVTNTLANDDVMKALLPQLVDIAPTYYCLGNHEHELQDKIDFSADISNTGTVLLDNKSTFFEKGGEKILIGGLSDFPYYDYEAPDFDNPERYFWEEFDSASKEYFSILLHHPPEYIGDMISGSNVDLVLCGHTHGGLIRIPFIGGLFAPNQGLFPKYDKGEFDFDGTTMIITAGLGNSNFLPRINNCAEICVINVN